MACTRRRWRRQSAHNFVSSALINHNNNNKFARNERARAFKMKANLNNGSIDRRALATAGLLLLLGASTFYKSRAFMVRALHEVAV